MHNTYLENITGSFGEFFFRIGLSPQEANDASRDILELALANLIAKLTNTIPQEEMPAFLASLPQSKEERFALFLEKAFALVGVKRATELFSDSFQETLDAYMSAMEKELSPAGKKALVEFKTKEIKANLEKILQRPTQSLQTN